MAEVTGWFSCHVKPIRAGIYQCRLSGLSYYEMLQWSGGKWRRLDGGMTSMGWASRDCWRGLTKEAK